MPDAVHAGFSTQLAEAIDALPGDVQYMPPGRHRIRATRNGEPVTLDVVVDADTAETLNRFLQEEMTKATAGEGDRPYFDFNHSDGEASAWPTKFFWAGEDPRAGGVRASVDWSGAGETAIKQKTFRRFSPTFFVDDQGRVTGSTTNMGGLVNRAAFKTIQPLFAKQTETMKELLKTLHELKLIDSIDLPDAEMAKSVKARHAAGEAKRLDLAQRVEALETEKEEAVKARAVSIVKEAVNAGRIAPGDADAQSFWTDAVLRDEAKAVKAMEALPRNPVLERVTSGGDPQQGVHNKMTLQQRKLAEVRAAHPQADFQTVFAKAQAEAPELFR